MRKLTTGVVVTCLLFLLAACGGSASSPNEAPDVSGSAPEVSGDPIKLTYAFFAPDGTFPAEQMKKWKEELESRTNGKVVVDLFTGGTLLTADNMYEGVRNGVADIGLSAMTYEPGQYPLISIAEMPSGYPSGKVASQALYDLMQEYPQEAFSDVKVITAFATEPAFLMTRSPVASLEDLKGMQIRISGNSADLLNSLGASAVGMSQAETMEALQTGVIEGNVSSREVLLDLKQAELTSYFTDYPLTVTTFAAVMNMDKWNSLPADVQAVIEELGPEMGAWAGEYLDNHVQEAIEWSKAEHGLEVVSLTPEEKQRWDEILQPKQDELVAKLQSQGLPAEEFKQKLYELIEKYDQQ